MSVVVCIRCGDELGKCSYVFGTTSPLCEICFDQLSRHAIKNESSKKLETWATWLRGKLWL